MHVKTANLAKKLGVIAFSILLIMGCGKKEEPATSTSKTKMITSTQATVVSTYPEDGGSLHHLDHPVYVHLSNAVQPDQLSFKVTPASGKWSIEWRSQGKQAVLNHTTPFKAGQQYKLSVTLKPDGVETNIQFTVFGPTSLQLITTAQKKGVIDINKAWTYRLQSVFEPDKLPDKFRSTTPLGDADWLIRDYMKTKPQLNPDTVNTLDRYLKRPDDPDSFLFNKYNSSSRSIRLPQLGPRQAWADNKINPRYTGGQAIDCDKGLIKIHVREHMEAKALEAKGMLDDLDMYNRFKQLLGREPRGDKADTPNGGDKRIDIYMVPRDKMVGAPGLCIPTLGSGQYSSAYIFIKENLSGKKLGSNLAHELFHAFQFSFDAEEDSWWMEATAQWSIDFIKKEWNVEWEVLKFVFLRSEFRMKPITEFGGNHEYGIYLFPYYMSQEYSDETIAAIWKNCEQKRGPSSLQAIDDELGFDDVFKEFVLFNLDDGSYKGKYKDHNGPLKLFEYHGYKEIELKARDDELLRDGKRVTIKIPKLSAVYVQICNYIDETKIPLLRFKLDQFFKNKDLDVQAVINPWGDSRYEDWSELEEKEFCLNNKNELFQSIALVLSNKSRTDSFEPELIMEVDADGCSEKRGRATVTTRIRKERKTKWEHKWPNEDVDRRTSNIKSQSEALVSFTFNVTDASIEKNTNSITETYEITHANIEAFTISGQSKYKDYHYKKKEECSWENVKNKQVLPPVKPKLQYGDSLSITFDLETGRAKYVSLPSLSVGFDLREKVTGNTSGCRDGEPYDDVIKISGINFPLGPVNSKSGKELASQAQPELAEMEQIVKEMEALSKKTQGMNYQDIEKFVEAFEKRHDTDKLAQNMEDKLISPDLKAKSGDGKNNIQGGGTKTENEKIENGTKSTYQEFRWQIVRQEYIQGN
jgi:hypothetical protein